MASIKNTRSGLGGSSRVLLSQGADQFDPDSLLGTEEEPTPPISVQPLLILTLSPPQAPEPFQIGGFFEGILTKKDELTIELTAMFPVALELSRFGLMKDPTTITSLETRSADFTSILELPDFQIDSVQLEQPHNNRVRIKVVLSRCPI